MAYRNVMNLAQELGFTSVALPVLSSDDYRGGMTADFLQTVAQRVLSATPTTVQEVYLVRPRPAEVGPAPLPPAIAERTDDERTPAAAHRPWRRGSGAAGRK